MNANSLNFLGCVNRLHVAAELFAIAWSQKTENCNEQGSADDGPHDGKSLTTDGDSQNLFHASFPGKPCPKDGPDQAQHDGG